jgi:hypothetical protein
MAGLGPVNTLVGAALGLLRCLLWLALLLSGELLVLLVWLLVGFLAAELRCGRSPSWRCGDIPTDSKHLRRGLL